MSEFSRVARMGSNDSKYGQRRNEFERGDAVIVRGLHGIADEGTVVKATATNVTIDGRNGRAALPRIALNDKE